MIRRQIKSITSSKTAKFEEKMNEVIKDLEDKNCVIVSVSSNISYAGPAGYMLNGLITYLVHEEEEVDELDDITRFDYGIDFGTGMSFDGGPISEA